MNWVHLLSYFFGGAFLANAVPHLVSGTMGRAFQRPFAKPPGEGLSSSTVNALWGLLNAAIAYCLVLWVSHFDTKSPLDVAVVLLGAVLLGAVLISVGLARYFGGLHGGNAPELP